MYHTHNNWIGRYQDIFEKRSTYFIEHILCFNETPRKDNYTYHTPIFLSAIPAKTFNYYTALKGGLPMGGTFTTI